MDAQSVEQMAKDPSVSDQKVFEALRDFLLEQDKKARKNPSREITKVSDEIGTKMWELRPGAMELLGDYIEYMFSGCANKNCGPKYSGGCDGCGAKAPSKAPDQKS